MRHRCLDPHRQDPHECVIRMTELRLKLLRSRKFTFVEMSIDLCMEKDRTFADPTIAP